MLGESGWTLDRHHGRAGRAAQQAHPGRILLIFHLCFVVLTLHLEDFGTGVGVEVGAALNEPGEVGRARCRALLGGGETAKLVCDRLPKTIALALESACCSWPHVSARAERSSLA